MSTKDAGLSGLPQGNMKSVWMKKVTNEKEALALGIEVGDFVSFDPRTIVTDTGFIKSSLIDKVSGGLS